MLTQLIPPFLKFDDLFPVGFDRYTCTHPSNIVYHEVFTSESPVSISKFSIHTFTLYYVFVFKVFHFILKIMVKLEAVYSTEI